MIADLSFMRPLALGLLALLPLLWWALGRVGTAHNPWRQHIDPELLGELTLVHDDPGRRRRRYERLLALIIFALLAIALAGPSWRETIVPTMAPRAEAVVVLGLNQSMMAADLTPDRLTRARIAVSAWLDQNPEQDTALVSYAGAAYRVAPLTHDRETLKHLIDTLQPDVMPRQGHNISAGLELATQMLSDHPGPKQLLLVTDSPVNAEAMAAATAVGQAGIELLVLSVGSREGAPIPLPNGRFATRDDGRLLMARVDSEAHKALANAAKGQWQDASRFQAERWSPPQNPQTASGQEQSERGTRQPQDDGPWLLLVAVLLLLPFFRRGALLLLPWFLLQPLTVVEAAELPEWLLNPPQRALHQYRANPSPETASAIPDRNWRGVAQFEQGDFAAAAEAFADGDDLSAKYNQALSLAHQDQLDEAIAGFENVLAADPDHAKARQNLELLEAIREQQQASESSEQEQSEGEQSDSEDQQSSDQSQGSSSEQGEQSDTQPDEQAKGDEPAKSGEDNSEQAEQSAEAGEEPQEPQPSDAALTELGENDDEQERAIQQWLNRVESDPSQLLRNRFRSQDRRRDRKN